MSLKSFGRDGRGSPGDGVSQQRGPLGAKPGTPGGIVMEMVEEFSTCFHLVLRMCPDCFALALLGREV